MELLRDRHPGDPLLDLALTHALLRQVAAGDRGPLARVFRPGPTMAFGRLDAQRPGFAAAAEAARAHGYLPVVRLGGGRAAGYDEDAVLVELVEPARTVAGGVQERFAGATAVVVQALRDAGLDPVAGELPGEYCPGAWSVHDARGAPKLAGIAQRTIRGASLSSAVVVVGGGDRLRAALVDVYAALELDWDPATAGGAADLAPGLTAELVVEAALAALQRRTQTVEGEPGDAALAQARELLTQHRV
ncbi:lipoate--protein ligase family protein [Conexibacter sp. SYSU D00693]|uniref:lipoate--protein ligase family protein n=1 Tax=Conexibacter sp. SYSU D00693 TaxID=2812560 RepID=UPI00196B2120|nr:lipoate--protein ligase family protein [Conexibacter sp. SYSU D00693]